MVMSYAKSQIYLSENELSGQIPIELTYPYTTTSFNRLFLNDNNFDTKSALGIQS